MVPDLTPTDRTTLLALARGAIAAHLAGGLPPAVPEAAAPWPRRGAFVTLEAEGELRGCIGHLDADRPLAAVVCDMAVAAARDDPRFAPLGAHELHRVRIEISVLSEAEALSPVAPERIRLGHDGLLVRRGRAVGVLLPQVATDEEWGPADFLAAVCRKAGLAPGAWRETATQVFTFQADVFGE